MSAGIVGFEDARLGNATDELRNISEECAMSFLLYLQKVHQRQINDRKLKPFYTYHSVECFLAKMGDCIAVFAVEHDDDDLKVSVMFAGVHGRSMKCGNFLWDGFDYDALRTDVI